MLVYYERELLHNYQILQFEQVLPREKNYRNIFSQGSFWHINVNFDFFFQLRSSTFAST